MKKKTYVRVITLLLAVLMILGVMAPAFTSYAASELSVINNSKDVVKVEGTPDGKDLKVGKLPLQIQGFWSGTSGVGQPL